ncbi:hypothetical protein ACQKH5_14135 [Hyphomonas sp. NPDC076900]|uniref:hypothetical protein n=2 Tax=unclassified Hyphomonas TaxID=2630699 RepID=UPI003CFE79C0
MTGDMNGLRVLVCATAILATVSSAQGQALREPGLLSRYHQLIAEFDRQGFAAFENDYLSELGPQGDPCLFGCNSGFSGNSPNVHGDGYREFLIRADLVTLARMLHYPESALINLERSTELLQTYHESYLANDPYAESSTGLDERFWDAAWKDYAGCVGTIIPPVLPAAVLRGEVQQLRYRVSLSPEDRLRLNLIDQTLRKMTAEDD